MAQLVWSILCRRIIVDEATKLVSFIDVLEGFEYGVPPSLPQTVQPLQALPLEFSLVTLWTRSDPLKGETARQRLVLAGPDPTLAPPQPIEIEVDLNKTRNYRTTVLFQGIPYLGDGDYVFKIELQQGKSWTPKTEVLLVVKRSATAAPGN
jgi:hypothetical protein